MTGVIAGQLNPKNKDAIDWHPKGLIGYGCHTILIIVDVESCKVVQTLFGHEKTINLLKFGLQEAFEDDPYNVKCVTSDIGGRIIVWNIFQGKKETSFQRPGDEICHMQWFTQYGIHSELLLTLHNSNSLVLWNTKNGDKMWILNFSTKLYSLAIDPKNYSNIAFSATNSVIFLKNVQPNDTPLLTDSNLQTIRFTPESSSNLVDGNSVVHLVFHGAYEDLLFVVFQLKVYLIHAESKQILSTINTENMFPLCKILPCSERDAFYLVHSNGVISFWQASLINHRDHFNAELIYDQTNFNDAQRLFSKHRVFGASLCPTTESTIALIFNSGKLVFFQMNHEDQVSVTPYRIQSLCDLTTSKTRHLDELCFVQSGIVPSLGTNATTVRIRPMDKVQTSQEQFGGKNLAAIGNSTGQIQFVDVLTGKLEKELNVHNCAVKCLEWAGPDMIISAAYSSSITANGTVRNDLVLIHVLTGAKKRIRPETDESPIQLLRVSYYQRYLAIGFRNDPLEIWDLFSQRMLRRMSRKCPIIVDMAWSGKHGKKIPETDDFQLVRENLVVLDNDNHLYHVIVKGLHVRDGKEVNTQWKSGSPPIRCMAWKDDLLAFGDVNGYLRIWDLSKKTFNQVNSQTLSGPITRCVFSKLFGDATIAVQYSKGIVLFDALCLKPSPNMLVTESILLDVDMFGVTPVCISSEGICRFTTTVTKNNSISEAEIPELLKPTTVKKIFDLGKDESSVKLEDCDSEMLHYLKKRLENQADPVLKEIMAAKLNGNLLTTRILQVKDSMKSNRQLPPSLLMFWNPEAYKNYAKQLTKVLLGTYKTTEQLDFAVEKAVVLGKQDWAKYALLNSEISISSDIYRLNAIKGCLLNSTFEAEEPRCFIKMVATNLIAQNHISDGMVLLFLIQQGADACRFLASNGQWLPSIHYSKMSQNVEDVEQLMLKWANLLCNDSNQVLKTFSAMIFTSLGQWQKAVDLLTQKDNSFIQRFHAVI